MNKLALFFASESTPHGETRSPFLIPDTTDASVTSVTKTAP